MLADPVYKTKQATSSPDGATRRTTAYLRGLLLVAAGGVLIESGAVTTGVGALILLVIFSLTNILLIVAPPRLVGSSGFWLAMGGTDLVVIGLTIHIAGTSLLAVSCLVMVLVVALGSQRNHTVIGATVVCVLHAWLMLGAGMELARTLAPQVLFLYAVALYFGYLVGAVHENRKLEEAGRLERKELTTLLDILRTVTSPLDLHQMTQTVVREVATLLSAARCSVIFVEEESARGFVKASNDDPDLNMLEIDLENYPEIRQAIETRKPVLIRDVLSDPLMSDVRDVMADMDVRSIMVIPLIYGEEILGTLCLRAAWNTRQFHPSDIDFCMAVAGVAANALKNAMLHRRASEDSIRHQRVSEQLNRIFDSSPDLIITTDKDGLITELNHAAEILLGRPAREIIGMQCEDLFGRVPTIDLMGPDPAPRASWNHSCTVTRGDGSQSALELNMSIMRDDAGTATGTVLLGRDMTELQDTHTQLMQANKVSTIGEVVAHVARELSDPISGVLGFTQMLLARPACAEIKRELDKILEAGVRCQKIVKNLLFLARQHKPERRYLGVNEIVDRTLNISKYQFQVNDVEVVRELDPDLPRTLLDRHQIQQVLLHLMSNAQQAMLDKQERGRFEIKTFKTDETIQVEISDNGTGMNEETLERVFDPLFKLKTKDHWTGLGLSASYGIVKEHGGRIRARSQEGEGTTFVIELPICESGQDVAQLELDVVGEIPCHDETRADPGGLPSSSKQDRTSR